MRTYLATILLPFLLCVLACCTGNDSPTPTPEDSVAPGLVAFRFTAVIDSVIGNPSFSAAAGDVVTGFFSFDPSATARSKVYTHQVFYYQTAPAGVQIKIGSTVLKVTPYSLGPYPFNQVDLIDMFEAQGSPSTINGYTLKIFTPEQASAITKMLNNTLQSSSALTLDQATALTQAIDQQLVYGGMDNTQAYSALTTIFSSIQATNASEYAIKVANNYEMGAPVDSISWSVNDLMFDPAHGIDYLSIGFNLSDSTATVFQDPSMPTVLNLDAFNAKNLVISGLLAISSG